MRTTNVDVSTDHIMTLPELSKQYNKLAICEQWGQKITQILQ
jgi:hypothetical protein